MILVLRPSTKSEVEIQTCYHSEFGKICTQDVAAAVETAAEAEAEAETGAEAETREEADAEAAEEAEADAAPGLADDEETF